MYRRMLLVIVLILAAGTAWGQAPSTPSEGESTKELLERIEKLEKRVVELEAKAGTTAAALSTAPAASPAQNPARNEPATGIQRSQASESAAQQAIVQEAETHYPSLAIRGFGDVDFSATNQKGTLSGFNLGQLDLQLASPLSRKISYFGEITFNAQPAGYMVEVERSFIRYDYNDHFKLSFGRYHTPIGYWNTAFHHGTWLQTTVERPEMVNEDVAFVPIHMVGFLAEGSIPSGGAGLYYNFGVGNGRGDILSRPGDAGDNNNNRAWVANVFARPARLYGLQFGASVYRDKIISPADGRNFREWITSAHVVWTKETPEILAEFANSQHQDILTAQVFNSPAFYVQFAYRLPWSERALKPYYRFEYIRLAQGEPILTLTGTDLTGSTLGIRYDISSFAAFKSEYRNTRRLAGEPRVNGVFFQTSFTF